VGWLRPVDTASAAKKKSPLIRRAESISGGDMEETG